MLLQRRAQAGRIGGEITPWAELNAAIASLRRLLQYGSPGREVRVFRVIDAPAAGGVSDRMYHVGFLFIQGMPLSNKDFIVNNDGILIL